MEFATSTPEMIADRMIFALSHPEKPKPVKADGARMAALMISELLGQ